jgi:hypothetical protein
MPKPGWVQTWKAFVDTLVETGGLAGGIHGWLDAAVEYDLVLAFLEFALDETDEWQLLEQPASYDHGYDGLKWSYDWLSAAEVDTILIRWAAVHLAVEFADWYPWSMADFGDYGMEVMARRYEYPSLPVPPFDVASTAGLQKYYASKGLAPEDSLRGVKSEVGFCHQSATAIRTKKDGTDLLYFLPYEFRNPAAAAWYARMGLCKEAGGSSWDQVLDKDDALENAWKAISILTEWYHGPQNLYSSCHPLAVVKETFDPGSLWDDADHRANVGTWTDLAGDYEVKIPGSSPPQNKKVWPICEYGIHEDKQPYPFQLLSCTKDGRQPWVHSAMVGGHIENWYWNERFQKNTQFRPPFSTRTVDRLRKTKTEGCHETSYFFAAIATAMNIPAGYAETLATHSSPKDSAAVESIGFTTEHHTVVLPVWGLCLPHGDALGAPGAALFPAHELFADMNVVLGPASRWLALLDQGMYLKPGVTYRHFVGHEEPVVPGLPCPKDCCAELCQSVAHVRYWIARRYFEALLAHATDPRYTQIALDAFTYCVEPYEMLQLNGKPIGGFGVFEALKTWTQRRANPRRTAPFPQYDPSLTKEALENLDAVVPSLKREDWITALGPSTLWEEQSFQVLLENILEATNLAVLTDFKYYLSVGAGSIISK